MNGKYNGDLRLTETRLLSSCAGKRSSLCSPWAKALDNVVD